MDVTANDVFYDLGSGLGKAVVQTALTTPVKRAIGIEFEPTRYDAAQNAKLFLLRNSLTKVQEVNQINKKDTKGFSSLFRKTQESLPEQCGKLSPEQIRSLTGSPDNVRKIDFRKKDFTKAKMDDATLVYNFSFSREQLGQVCAALPKKLRMFVSMHGIEGVTACSSKLVEERKENLPFSWSKIDPTSDREKDSGSPVYYYRLRDENAV
ncbi:unnamed protein product [Amoebophrya sp. A120]|nr:unnamed protein product [Amoebophrya sp. A120]|eukprot:GSA120T00002326001.1